MPNPLTAKLLPLTLEQYAEERKLPVDWLVKTWGLKNVVHDGVACIEQPYVRMDGKVCAPRYRYSNAKKSPTGCGDRIILYGQKQLINKDNPASAVLVEGESDTQTLRYAAFTALGIPGTSMWDKCIENDPDILTFLSFRTIFVIQEPPSQNERTKGLDSPSKMIAKIRKSLPMVRVIAVRLWEFAPRDANGDPLYKDVSGLWMHYDGNVGKFGQALSIAADAAGKADDRGARQIQSILSSDVEMKLTRWLWYDHIPLGGITVFAGMPQKGKSTAAVDVVSRLTNGRDFPGSSKQVDACEVAILASEDNYAETTVPRLKAAGAELSKVHLIQGTSDGKKEWEIALDTDLDKIRAFLAEHPEIKLVVMDPVTSYIGDLDPNKPKEVRPFLTSLKKFAEEMGVSLLLIMHLSKNPDVAALHRVGGAATWIEVPRSVWFFDVKLDEETGEPAGYVMVNGKLNIVADARKKSMEYAFAGVDVEIEGVKQSTGTIRWGEESSITLEQQYNRQKGKTGPAPVEKEAAKRWLREHLADGEKESLDAGQAAGHKEWALRAAKKEMGIKHRRGTDKVYVWSLPAEDSESDGDAC